MLGNVDNMLQKFIQLVAVLIAAIAVFLTSVARHAWMNEFDAWITPESINSYVDDNRLMAVLQLVVFIGFCVAILFRRGNHDPD